MAEQTPEYVRACYDTVARAYADRFSGELENKPLDRELLRRFAQAVRKRGPVYDLGCGPGHTTALLHASGASVTGLDLSPELIAQARLRHPKVPFQTGDLLALPLPDRSLVGIVAFYAIVHFSAAQLQQAIGEMHRVIVPGGRLLLSFHVGTAPVHLDEFLGAPVSLDFFFFPVEQVMAALAQAGFRVVEANVREPYPDVEYPCRRAYVIACVPDVLES